MLLHVTFSLRRPPARGPEGECMVKTYGLTHVALAVRDLDCAFSSYSRVFGMKAVSPRRDVPPGADARRAT
jgi:hypothetical protein